MRSRRTRSLVWCLALGLVTGTATSAQVTPPPPTPVPDGQRSDGVFLGDGGGSELPGPAVSQPKGGPPAGQIHPGSPGAATLTPGAGGGGGITPPDDHGDPPDDHGGDGTTPDGAGDDPPDDGGTPGPTDQDSAAPSWRLTLQRRADSLTVQLDGEGPGGFWQLRLHWQRHRSATTTR